MKKIIFLVALLLITVSNKTMALEIRHPVEVASKKFIDKYVKITKPIRIEWFDAYWKATTTGKKEWYKKYEQKELENDKIFSDKFAFAEIKDLKDSYPKYMKKYPEYDPEITRQLDLLYLDFLENQIDQKLNEKMVKRATALEEKFNTFRAKMDGKEVSDNKLKDILRKSSRIDERQKAWEASKQVGTSVANDLKELVKIRNKAAKSLGFKNYYIMMLELQELNEKDLFKLLDDLAKDTNKPFKELKDEIDTAIAKKFKINKKDLRPWHYEDPFFQEAPQVYNASLDKYFKDKDILRIAKKQYGYIGMPVDDILKRSDLYERKGKSQHAYCLDVDAYGDIRILANIKNDEQWMSTMLHELGHAVYDKYFGKDVPYFLRDSAHIFVTEGIAELFGAFTTSSDWLARYVDPSKKKEFESLFKDLRSVTRAQRLIFARWVEVMAHFERELYLNPDQDLNDLWWKMVEKYQFIKKPAGRNNPDWAAKIHLSSSPVYYHNYQLGEILASQLINYIEKNIGPFDKARTQKAFGNYLKDKIFKLGSIYKWNDLIEHATGEKLTAKYFAKAYFK